LSDDLCTISHDEGCDYFIRVIVEIPIREVGQGFMWGVWISVSKENFDKYVKHFRSDSYTDHYFGWFSSRLPGYPDTLSIKSRACVQPGGNRPVLELEESEHPLCVDYHQGISRDRAVSMAESILHGDQNDQS
ncbi:MAG: DUF2199 domain-containing protein, partial [Gammaproteobacteria bacterium]|nr:DUF2199 domain-containing protein [Gammaproteobacteria bacterium]